MSGQAFFAMGGYAAFVWPSFALVLALLAGNAIAARRLLRRARRDALRRLEHGEEGA